MSKSIVDLNGGVARSATLQKSSVLLQFENPSSIHFATNEGIVTSKYTCEDVSSGGDDILIADAHQQLSLAVIGSRNGGELSFVRTNVHAIRGSTKIEGGISRVAVLSASLCVVVSIANVLYSVSLLSDGCQVSKIVDVDAAVSCQCTVAKTVFFGLESGSVVIVAASPGGVEVNVHPLENGVPVEAVAAAESVLWAAQQGQVSCLSVNGSKLTPSATIPIVQDCSVRATHMAGTKAAAAVVFSAPQQTDEDGNVIGEAAYVAEIAKHTNSATGETCLAAGGNIPVPPGSDILGVGPVARALRKRWSVAMVDRNGAWITTLTLNNNPIAAPSPSLGQEVMNSTDDELVFMRQKVESAVDSVENGVNELLNGKMSVPRSHELQRDIVELQTVTLALSERENALAFGNITPENSVSQQLLQRLHTVYARRAAAHILGVSGTITLPLQEFITRAKNNRREHLDDFKQRFFTEFNMVQSSAAMTVTEMEQWAPRSLCVEILLGHSGMDSHSCSVVDIVNSIGTSMTDTQAMLILYITHAGNSKLGTADFNEFLAATGAARSCVQWAEAAFAADAIDRDYNAAAVDTGCLEGIALVPALLESFCDGNMLDVAYRFAPIALAHTNAQTPLGGKLATRLSYVMYQKGNMQGLVELVKLSEGTSWRRAMLKVLVHAALAAKDISAFEIVGVKSNADAEVILAEFNAIGSETALRLRVQFLILICEFAQALRECEELSTGSGHENQLVAAYLRSLVSADEVYKRAAGTKVPASRHNPTAAATASSSSVLRDEGAVTRVVVPVVETAAHVDPAAAGLLARKTGSTLGGSTASATPGTQTPFGKSSGSTLFNQMPSISLTPVTINNPRKK